MSEDKQETTGPPQLSEEQQEAVRRLHDGESLLLTGLAGTGKSFTLSRWLEEAKRVGMNVAVTASTGIAATHIEGKTIHSWAGVGIGKKSAAAITNGHYWKKYVYWTIRNTDALVIDEISMLDGEILDLVSDVCAIAKRKDEPFGGMQVVFVGDMGQLPPVEEHKGFPFEASCWKQLNPPLIELTKSFRQEDAAFAAVLREIRMGSLSDHAARMLGGRVNAYDPDELQATRIMTHNHMVDAINREKFNELSGEEVVFTAFEEGDPKALLNLDKTCRSPKILRLKEGARVMFTKNDKIVRDEYGTQIGRTRYANGTQGTVVGLEKGSVHVKTDAGGHVVVDRDSWEITNHKGYIVAARTQFPLRLAYAISVHKSQGMSLDLVSTNLAEVFAPGQAYVALSRARTLEGLNVEDWKGAGSIRVHPKVMKFLLTQQQHRVDVVQEWF